MHIFVYGSLKKGYFNHPLLDRIGARFVGKALSPPNYDIFDLGAFPGMIYGDYSVAGEVYRVDDITPVDRLEGHPNFYKREPMKDFNFRKVNEPVETYILQVPDEYSRKKPLPLIIDEGFGPYKEWKSNRISR